MTAPQELLRAVCSVPAILLVAFWVIVFLAVVMAETERNRNE